MGDTNEGDTVSRYLHGQCFKRALLRKNFTGMSLCFSDIFASVDALTFFELAFT